MQSRIGAALSLYTFAVLGLFLCVAPWTPVWTQATYALLPERVGRWVLSGWVRGIVSGLGALDLVIAVQVGGEMWRRLRLGQAARDDDDAGSSAGR